MSNWGNHPKHQWTNSTSYSRGQTDRTPTSWTIYFENYRLSVWKDRHEESQYICSIYGKIDDRDHWLKAKNGPDARKEAFARLQAMIQTFTAEMVACQDVLKDFEED